MKGSMPLIVNGKQQENFFEMKLAPDAKIPFKYVFIENNIVRKAKNEITIDKSQMIFEYYEGTNHTSLISEIDLSTIDKIYFHRKHYLLCISNKKHKSHISNNSPEVQLRHKSFLCVDMPGMFEYSSLIRSLEKFSKFQEMPQDIFEKFHRFCLPSEYKLNGAIKNWSSIFVDETPPEPEPNNSQHSDTREVVIFTQNKKRKLEDRNVLADIADMKKNVTVDRIFVYKANKSCSFEIPECDIKCLEPGKYLNDNIINFYAMYIYYEMLSRQQREETYVFNCFFNTKLIGSKHQQMNDTPQIRHSRVAKWTKNVDIFSKNFIIIPVCEDKHWFLVIICFPWMSGLVDYCKILNKPSNEKPAPANTTKWATQERLKRVREMRYAQKSNPKSASFDPNPCILILDSVGTHGRAKKVNIIREYLDSEWNARRAEKHGDLIFNRNTMRGWGPKIPKQNNNHDCGIYVLRYIEEFFMNPITDYGLEYFQSNLQNWFPTTDVKQKRHDITKIIHEKCLIRTRIVSSDDDKDDDIVTSVHPPIVTPHLSLHASIMVSPVNKNKRVIIQSTTNTKTSLMDDDNKIKSRDSNNSVVRFIRTN